MPEVWAGNLGGLFDVAVSPECEETGWIHLTYALRESGKGRLLWPV